MKMSTQCLNPMRHLFQPDPIRKSLTLISHSLLQVWPLPTAWGIRSKWFTTVAWFHQGFRLTPLDPRLNSPFLWNCLSNQLIGHIALTFSAKSSWQEWCPPLKVIQERWYRSERKIHLWRLCQTGIISLIVRPSNFYKNNNNQAIKLFSSFSLLIIKFFSKTFIAGEISLHIITAGHCIAATNNVTK